MSDIPTEAINPTIQPRPPRIPPQNTDGDTMERLFQALFYRIAVLYARAIPKHVRRLSESAILVMVNISNKTHHLESFSFSSVNYLYEFIDLSSSCLQSKTSHMSFSFT